MKRLRILLVILFLGLQSFQQFSDSDKLNAIIKKHEADREYGFKRYTTAENTIKWYQAESDFAKKLKEELVKISEEGLSESEKISKELLLFVLQDKIDSNRYKTYLNTITNESA